jgi:putative ribosome biogenesis GTPase RsgA
MPEKTDIKREGITRAQKLMKEELEGWKTINISLAIIGNSGVGKSSFINAIRGYVNVSSIPLFVIYHVI